MTEHPITPPPELVQQWASVNGTHYEDLATLCGHIATRAAQWGADQELEACLRLVEIDAGEDAYDFARYIRAARRPKPPSLKEQALDALETLNQTWTTPKELNAVITIRRALEALSDD